MRAIDADELLNEAEYDSNFRLIVSVDKINRAPTLTSPNEWVSVEERLPEKKQDVLMLFKSGNMAVGWWYDADEHITLWCTYTDNDFYTYCDDIPSHWMHLPSPPNTHQMEWQ